MTIIKPRDVLIFEDSAGKQPYIKWVESLDVNTRARIEQRVLRLSLGHFGEYKFIQNEVYELKLDFGAGYRIYYGNDGNAIVVLLSGGDKGSQKKDIKRAIEYWKEYKENKNG